MVISTFIGVISIVTLIITAIAMSDDPLSMAPWKRPGKTMIELHKAPN